ncbi:SPOR domain-containing protein [Labrenzia sp. R4_1]|uniref:SPOR domain-containing protein n=1 Tax=Labrenzia sp. R4_1 TaxID=2821106 RepID=UPI001ADC51CF|nr:SPOR domain-containing protein [Labrenzia sp. R4_1]MBO9426596.1 SPOR domain-containing protein [Labrenzia sp. R4_1]
MSDEYDKKRPDTAETPAPSGGNRPSGEDPLIELARIVHNNKQLGAPVSSGRVGSTDYFADLDDLASEPKPAADLNPPRQEPVFGAGQSPEIPRSDAPLSSEPPRFNAPQQAPDPGSIVTPDVVQSSESSAAGYQAQSEPRDDVRGWPQVPQLDTIEATAASAINRPAPSAPTPSVSEPAQPAFQPSSPPQPRGPAVDFGRDFGTGLAASVANDLEQNLTAELEDELKGALRQTIDPPEDQTFDQRTAPAPISPEPQTTPQTQQPTADSSYYSGGYQAHTASYSQAPAPVRSDNYSDTVTPDDTVSRAGAPRPAFGSETPPSTQAFERPAQDIQPEVSSPSALASQRPAINEDDLFAALTTPQGGAASESAPQASEDSQKSIAGIDTLLADLDFPERDERARQQSAAEHSSEPAAAQASAETKATAAGYAAEAPGRQSADDIDDMVWPAAADAVRDLGDDDTPPPPEGYDLDAVARAMQESDPTLKGSGVLPPHSRAEQAAVPHAEERSRRGIFVAAGVLGVAALGAVGFFFLDTDTIAVPDGPPPVISGLQEPLKIFPEEQDPSAGNNQSAKLIYDRVDGRNENAPTQLARPETPEPASLPPAPAGVQSGAELVPGATKRVRTVVVRPDGTIVSGEDAAPAATGTAQPATPAPAEPRVVATQPITSTPSPEPAAAPTPAEPAAGTPQPATPAPTTPAIVAAAEPAAPVEEPAGPVPTVLPRKKPAVPVQVAQAPAAATNPAPATQNNGPLNLSQPASAPAPATTTAPAAAAAGTGSIPAGTYIVQVTSQRSASAASDAYSSLQRRYPSIIGNVNAVIVAADLGDRGVFYRARIPTGSRDEAIRLCEQLQGAGGDCFVRRQ